MSKLARSGLPMSSQGTAGCFSDWLHDSCRLVPAGKLWSSEGVKKAEPGFDVGAWQTILSIPKTDEMIVKVLIPENQFTQVKIGDRVKVKIPSLNSKKYIGTIDRFEYSFVRQESIETGKELYNSQEPSGETHFQAIIRLPNLGGLKVKPGALARIELALRSGAQL